MVNGKILIVDRDKDSLRAMVRTLQGEFEKVIPVQSADRIRDTFRQTEVDVVLLDSNFKSSVHN